VAGLTFDTGALIGLERRRLSMRKVYDAAAFEGMLVTVPTAVVAEWWRAGQREKERAALLRSMRVDPLNEYVARLAGAATGLVPGATTIDAIVMASASLRGDVVYTSDVDDLEPLRAVFPAVRVLHA
jgi:hypothetical protein